MYLNSKSMIFVGSKNPNSILFTFQNKIAADAGQAFKDGLCLGIVRQLLNHWCFPWLCSVLWSYTHADGCHSGHSGVNDHGEGTPSLLFKADLLVRSPRKQVRFNMNYILTGSKYPKRKSYFIQMAATLGIQVSTTTVRDVTSVFFQGDILVRSPRKSFHFVIKLYLRDQSNPE